MDIACVDEKLLTREYTSTAVQSYTIKAYLVFSIRAKEKAAVVK